MMKRILTALFACGLIAQSGLAAEGAMLKVKAGSCNFKVMDANGVKPVGKATVTIADTAKGAAVATAITDATGRCKLDVAQGHYILKVNDQLMAVVQSAPEHEITTCNIMLKKAVVVGDGEAGTGGELGTGSTKILGMSKTTAAIVAGGLIVGGALIVDNQQSDGDSK